MKTSQKTVRATVRDMRRGVVRLCAITLLVTAACAAGCDGSMGAGSSDDDGASGPGGPGTGTGGGTDPCLTGTHADNDVIRAGLAPHCAGCHTEGDNGFFASLQAFEDLLVADPRLVVPGDPDASILVMLLEGRGPGSSKQMPLSGPTYAAMADAGTASLSMADIRTWVTELGAVEKNQDPDPGAVTVRRMTAAQVESALMAQLGLGFEDFFKEAQEHGIVMAEMLSEDHYASRSPDALPAPRQANPGDRHQALGGFSTVQSSGASTAADAGFIQALVPLSQRWCKLAIAKPDPSVLFPHVTPVESSGASGAAIEENIRYLHLHFLGDVATDEEVTAVLDDIFVPLEAETDPQTAWAGVCSYFIRHPRWIFY